MKISLKPEQEQFIQSQIALGKYQTAEQVIGEALKLLEEQNRRSDEMRLEELRSLIEVGTSQIATGLVTDGEEVLASLSERIRRRSENGA
jgi:antitoxin ParD1/3/4